MSTFITNSKTNNLIKRIEELIPFTKELKILTGFFYFSGLHQFYNALKNNKDIELKILVGLNVDKLNQRIIEVSEGNNRTNKEKTDNFFYSLKTSLNSEELDKKDLYREVKFFLNLIKQEKLKIRKTRESNHAKLYIFIPKQAPIKKTLIIGSSNLTKAGMLGQSELNVELGEIYVEAIEKEYFDKLWESGIKITEQEVLKDKLIKIIENETMIKEISPFQAYCLILKNYLDSLESQELNYKVLELFDKNKYKKYKYQLDAIKQALAILNETNGVILADVVGLGKTVMACAIAKQLNKPGIIICPPSLMGDQRKSDNGGWYQYKREFELNDWEIWSLGDLKKLKEEINRMSGVEVIIVDEAHRFRNEDTEGYDLLRNICRGKKVILLTATPFNNKPADILSLIKLFQPTKKSFLTLDGNIAKKFASFQYLLNKTNYIIKNYQSKDKQKIKQALNYYRKIFKGDFFDIIKVKNKVKEISSEIRSIIKSVTLRRNRLDLQKNPRYQDEIYSLSKLEDPKELFYELTKEQNNFYDEVIKKYFENPENGGLFKGAIYRPFVYEEGLYGKEIDEDEMDFKKNKEYLQQKNLYDIMRRLLVKRFESSFGAFYKSLDNFIKIYQGAIEFVNKHKKFILDRDLLNKLNEMDEDEIGKELEVYQKKLTEKKNYQPKLDKVYQLESFKQKDLFLKHLAEDCQLFIKLKKQVEELNLIENDPKADKLIAFIKEELSKPSKNNEPKRKIILFSEYADTINHLKSKFDKSFKDITLSVFGNLNSSLIDKIQKNFNASNKEKEDQYFILLATDKLSEGFNLNRAGMVINYDIPWNPVRVVQRVGRINRISQKVFEKLYIYNFFPTEKGSEIVKSREIAQQKMFMIHNILGEDAKIFEPGEEVTQSNLYARINQNPDLLEEESFETRAYIFYSQIKEKYPQVIESLKEMPPRVKVGKKGKNEELLVFIKKNRQVFVRIYDYLTETIKDLTLESAFEKIACDFDEKLLPWDTDSFWEAYEKLLNFKLNYDYISSSDVSLEKKAMNTVNYFIEKFNKNEIDLNSDQREFLFSLKDDISYYGTLSKISLRKIVDWNNYENDKNTFYLMLDNLAKDLGGYHYLEKEKTYLDRVKKEVIVAVQNKK